MLKYGLWNGYLFPFLVYVFCSTTITHNIRASEVFVLADSRDAMQCVAKCVGYEGKLAFETCKWRCGNISSQPQNTHDCMSIYKQCLKTCGSEKSCKKVCKDHLMHCS